VNVRLPGASPDEMSTSIAEPLEQALSGVAGVDEIESRLGVGTARITVKFVLERDINEAAQDVREKVAGALGSLPPQVLPPVIAKVDPDAQPIYSVAVAGPYPLRTITEVADKQIRRALEAVDGVGEVSIAGGRAREIHVELDLEKLTAHGLSVGQVRDAIQSDNVEVPGGRIDQGDAEVMLRTPGRFDRLDQFGQIVVAHQGGAPVRVADVARVEDSEEDARTSAFVEGQRAIVIDVRRQSGQNTIAVIAGVKQALKEVEPLLPPGLKLIPSRDDSRFIYASIASLQEHLILGSILASLVVLLFIRNVPAMIISALAIPASLIASFTFMRVLGFTLNTMTLLGLTLAVGIVIDDAIVVLENIFRKIEEEGLPPFRAAVEGTSEVLLGGRRRRRSRWSVIFLPVAFMTGYAQRFIYPFGITMASAIMVSFLIAVTLTPMLGRADAASRPAGHRARDERAYRWDRRPSTPAASAGRSRTARSSSRSPCWCSRPRSRSPRIVGPLVPAQRGPGGIRDHGGRARRARRSRAWRRSSSGMAKQLETVPGIAHVVPTIFERVNHCHLLVQLLPIDERKQSQEQIAMAARKTMAGFAAYRPTVVFKTPIGGGESNAWPILVNLYGPDLRTLSGYALRLNERLSKLPQFIDVKARVNLGNPELRVDVDRQRAADLGVRVASLASALRLMVSGEDEITSYREDGERYPVKMRVREEQRNDVQSVGGLMVGRAPAGWSGSTTSRGSSAARGRPSITRLDRQFAMGVSGDLRPARRSTPPSRSSATRSRS
jgi:HAE1 family hydrophobic/amphiphilic exporter-1